MKRKVTLFIFLISWILCISASGQTARNLKEILDDTIAYQQAIAVSEIVSFEQETQVFVAGIQTGTDERDDLKILLRNIWN